MKGNSINNCEIFEVCNFSPYSVELAVVDMLQYFLEYETQNGLGRIVHFPKQPKKRAMQNSYSLIC